MHNNDIYSSPWIRNIEKIFNDCGMSNIWKNFSNVNHIWIKKAISLKLNDMYFQEWHSDINKMNSCFCYKMFKDSLKLENYLLNLNISESINLCKFRCRNSKIPVHVLGYKSQK